MGSPTEDSETGMGVKGILKKVIDNPPLARK